VNGLQRIAALVFCVLFAVQSAGTKPPGRWSEFQAKRWAEERGWLVGCNFIRSITRPNK
jgi:hypothetical protein